MRGFFRSAIAALVLVTAGSTAGCSLDEPRGPFREPGAGLPSPSASAPTDPLVFSFDFDNLGMLPPTGRGAGEVPLHNTGSQPVTIRVATASTGVLRSVPDREGGFAARFPWHGPRARQRMVLTVSSPSVDDPLSPGPSDFAFGADFTLDSPSEGGRLDNGNSLIQRGRSGDPAQYKIQIVNRVASCRIAGAAGEVVVEASHEIRPNTWYRVVCRRTGDEVTLELGTFNSPPVRAAGSGPTGAVYVPASTPLLLGGKANGKGEADTGNSDQFNGALDNVFLEIDRTS